MPPLGRGPGLTGTGLSSWVEERRGACTAGGKGQGRYVQAQPKATHNLYYRPFDVTVMGRRITYSMPSLTPIADVDGSEEQPNERGG